MGEGAGSSGSRAPTIILPTEVKDEEKRRFRDQMHEPSASSVPARRRSSTSTAPETPYFDAEDGYTVALPFLRL